MAARGGSRDAENRQTFVDGVVERLGVPPEVVTGDEEAALSFDGATRELRGADATFAAPYLVCDIGGGSTEFVLGDEAGMRAARSVDVGCARMAERHLHSDPPTADEVAAPRVAISAAIAEVETSVPLHEARTLIGLAGSVRKVAGLALG